ncbi:tRNA 2'-phosphotransferase 1 [Acropora cervicornis]|uniref:2'-phosphotransferase n=1 Tax=Acropora cervicornis TaxID=6130 RepID=A0AAD9QUB1_ACRCE|nr:tRNA 2'-phosphotransferase 1 [Acropora cervicornis]
MSGRRGASGGGRDTRKKSDHNVKLSKALSYILRHGAAKEGLQMTEVKRQFKHYSEDEVQRVVHDNDKQRFSLRNDPSTNRLQVRANQGHSMQVGDLDLELITDHTKAPKVIHGTYRDCWEQIEVQGLSRMKRNHIHFAIGEPGEDGVISGIRGSCEILIYINLKKALNGENFEENFKF